MRISTARSIKDVAAFAGVLYGFGAVVGAIGLGWSWLTNDSLPSLTWWQVLLAPGAIVIVWLLCELVGTFVGNGFSMREPETPGRRRLGKLGIILLLVTLLLVLPLVKIGLG